MARRAVHGARVPRGPVAGRPRGRRRAAAGAAALTPTQAALLNASTNPRIPYNLDSWDGYPLNREAILQTVKAQGKKLVTLSGDSHNAWFANVTTLAGEKVGVEFAGSSVTAPGFEAVGLGALASSLDGSALVPQLGSAAIGAGLAAGGVGNVFGSFLQGALRNPAAADGQQGRLFIGFAAAELLGLIAFAVAMIILYAV